MATPKLSVRLQCYQHGQYLAQAIESVLAQKTNFPFELVIADDCSDDDSESIIHAYQKKYPNLIRVLDRRDPSYQVKRKELGRLYNFTSAVDACRGQYIALLDGDDYWTDPHKLEIQVNFLEANKDYAICFHKTTRLGSDKIHKDTNEPKTDSFGTQELLLENIIETASCVCRSNLFESWPSWFYSSPIGDFPYHILNSLKGKIKYIDRNMAVYRIHNQSAWAVAPALFRYKNKLLTYILVSYEIFDNKNKILKPVIIKILLKIFRHSVIKKDSRRQGFHALLLATKLLCFNKFPCVSIVKAIKANST